MSKHKPAKTDSRRAQLRAAQIAQAKKQKSQRIAIITVSALVTVVLVIGIVVAVRQFSQAKAEAAPPNANAQQSGIRVYPKEAQQGAPVVSLFLDYQCPACANFEQTYGAKLAELAKNGDIQLEYRTMTFLDTNLRNDSSVRAANAAACADVAGHYSDYHLAVFAAQPAEGVGYTDDQLTQQFTATAGITGPDLETFDSCYANKRYSDFVDQVDREAGRAGVSGTPTLQVNGKALDLSTLTGDPNALHDEIMKLK